MTVGASARALDWDARTSGRATFSGDVNLDGSLHAAVLRSPHAHARIRAIDVAAATRAPGVVAVLTPDHLPDRCYHHLGEPFSDRAVLARGVVRFIGEEVAAVAAETLEQARAACALIEVDWEVLPAVTSPAAALAPGAPRLHPHADGNISSQVSREYGDVAEARADASVTVSGAFSYARAAHASMEPHTVLAAWDEAEQRLDLWPSSQAPYFIRYELAHVLDLELDQVHTHDVAVGGSFGAKAKVCEHEAIASALSIRSGRPVRLALDRSEEFGATKTRHPYEIESETGADASGHITHRDVRMVVDNGAYNHNGPSVPGYSAILAGSMYRIRAARADAVLAYTNTEPGGSFRGYGNPQITFALESQVDELADALGLDPIELRIRNANLTGDTTLTGWLLGSAKLVECLEAARDAIGWDAKRQLGGTGRGVGVAAAIHVSGANAYPNAEESGAAVDVYGDSRIRVRFAGSDAGTGQRTVLGQIAAEELGSPLAAVEVVMMASEGTPRDLGAWSSRGTFMGGHAVATASRAAADRLRQLAGEKFACPSEDVQLRDGEAIAGDQAVPIGDLVALADDADDGVLTCEGTYRTSAVKMDRATGTGNFSEAYSFVVQAAEVEVDRETGAVKVLQVVTAHDCGRVINPMAAEGQAVGAVVMGLGAALGEEVLLEAGRPVNPAYVDYPLPRASDVPPINAIFVESHDPHGPHGAKGIGEIGLVPTPAAVANAIAHATGVRLRAMPFTPEKVLAALTEAGATGPAPSLVPRWRRPSRWWVGAVRAAYPRGLHSLLHRYGTRFARDRSLPAQIEEIINPATVSEAVVTLKTGRGRAAIIAGGTDSMPARRQGIERSSTLVDLLGIDELHGLSEVQDGQLRIGATTTLAELADHTEGTDLAVLSETIATIAGPQVRATATIAGNLCQEKRCWFFRNGFDCYKRGGVSCPCYAVTGDHRFHHAVVGAHRCQAVTPSDLATTLGSLGATVIAHGGGGLRTLDVLDLYKGPGETVLGADEVLTEVRIPLEARSRVNRFHKLQLSAGGFAITAVATSLQVHDSRVTDARVVLGGVAPTPLRARRIEDAIRGVGLHDEAAIRRAASAWAADADPLPNNAWKVQATSALVARCLVSSQPQSTGR